MNHKGIEFIHCDEYIESLGNELKKKPQFVRFVYFKMQKGAPLMKLLPYLEECIQNGTRVEFYLDAIFSQDILRLALLPARFGKALQEERKRQAENREIIDKLKHIGAHIVYTNKPGFINKHILSFIRRDHRKIVSLHFKGRKVAYFGASNIDDGGYNDYMLKVTNPRIAEYVDLVSSYNDKNLPKKDLKISINKGEKLIFDIGNHFRSSILKESIKHIKSAEKEIYFVSQLPPEIQLIRYFISAAKRGVQVHIVMPDVSHFRDISTRLALRTANAFMKRHKTITIHHCSKGFTHAKILVADKAVVLGSHNLSYIGVYSGTQELSIFTKDEYLYEQTMEFIHGLL